MLPVASPLHAAGFHVLLLDARGHGRSDGGDVSSMPGFADDVERALLWLRKDSRVEPDRIVLVGHSVGAGACLLVQRSTNSLTIRKGARMMAAWPIVPLPLSFWTTTAGRP
jgi:alpha-beta hydrolase superfamily lysophospholipase